MKRTKLTAWILCFTMLFSITSGIFSAAFASDTTTGSAYSLDTTTGSAYKVDKGPMLFSTKAKTVEVAEETPVPDYSAYAAHKGMYATFSKAGYFEACQDKPTTYKDMGIAMSYCADEFTEDILFEVKDYTVVHDYYDITDEDTGAVTGVTTVSSLWYQLDIISGETIGTEEPLFQNGFWVFQNYLAGTEPYEYDALTLFAPEVGKIVQFNTDVFPILYASIGGAGFGTMKEVPSAMVIIEKYTDENGEVWYYVDAVEGETWPTDCAGYHYVKASDVTIVEQEEEEETPALETTTDGKAFAIYDANNALPAGAILDVEAIDEETTTYIEETAFGISKLPEGFAGLAYDISILDENNEKVQPDGSVVVRISGIDTENKFFAVAHFPGMSYKNIVGNTILNYEELEVTTIGEEYIEFVTDGFSTYYIVSGSQTENFQGDDSYYILKGTTVFIEATLEQVTFPDGESKRAVHGFLGLQVDSAAKSYAADNYSIELSYTNILDRNITFRTTSETKTGTYVLKSILDDWGDDWGGTFTINVVTPEEMFDILNGLKDEDENGDGIIDTPKTYFKILNDSTMIPVEPAAITQTDANTSDEYTYVTYNGNSENTFHETVPKDTNGQFIGLDTESLLDLESIANAGALKQNAQGNNIIGIVDTSGQGEYTLEHVNLTNGDWHQLLKDYIAYCKNNIQVKISGNENFQNITPTELEEKYGTEYRYQMYPYVIKLVGKTDGKDGDLLGWHVDCAIIDKQKYSLIYDFNLPSTVEFKDGNKVTIPDTSYHTPGTPENPTTVTVESIESNGTPIGNSPINNSLTILDNETNKEADYTFQGWNTRPDGQGAMYQPGNSLPITENITLYAIWKIPGTMRIVNTEVFEDANDPRKDTARNYTFTITVSGGGVNANRDYGYTILNTEYSSFVSKGSIKSGATVAVSGGQTVLLNNVPDTATVTVKETGVIDAKTNAPITVDKIYYRIGSGSSVEVDQSTPPTANGTTTNAVEFIHEYKAQLGNLTIKANNVDIIDKDQSFIYRISKDGFSMDVVIHCPANQNSASVTINSLPIGDYTVTELSDWSWRYTPINGNSQQKTITAGATNTATFGHERNKLWWLDGNAWRNILSS